MHACVYRGKKRVFRFLQLSLRVIVGPPQNHQVLYTTEASLCSPSCHKSETQALLKTTIFIYVCVLLTSIYPHVCTLEEDIRHPPYTLPFEAESLSVSLNLGLGPWIDESQQSPRILLALLCWSCDYTCFQGHLTFVRRC